MIESKTCPHDSYSLIAPESLVSASYSQINSSHSHDLFWTETWANYLSKGYFGSRWLGDIYYYPAKQLSDFNAFRIYLSKIPHIISPIIPF